MNYLALLGWGIADDRDVFDLAEMVRAFDVVDVNSNPARFDQKKAEAINAEHIRRLDPAEFATRLRAFFEAHGYDTGLDEAGFATAAELVQTRVVVLSEAWNLLKFLDDGSYEIDPAAAAKELGSESVPVLDAACEALDGVADVEHRRYRSGAEDRADRRAGTQAPQGIRPDPGGCDRRDGQPTAVRVAGTAGPRSAACTGCARPETGQRGIFGSLHSVVWKPGIVGSDQLLWVPNGVWCNWQHS